MSATINFAATTGAGAKPSAAQAGDPKKTSHMILPYEVLFNLVGRRVTVLLTTAGQELEGTLESVDSDKGDLFLSEVVQYMWVSPTNAASASGETEEQLRAAAQARADDGYRACFGGGERRQVRQCRQAMVNSAFVACVTPTLFIPS